MSRTYPPVWKRQRRCDFSISDAEDATQAAILVPDTIARRIIALTAKAEEGVGVKARAIAWLDGVPSKRRRWATGWTSSTPFSIKY